MKDARGRTPRQAVVDELGQALVRVRWDHPSFESIVTAVFHRLCDRAQLVDGAVTLLSLLPLPPALGQRLDRRTPFSVGVARYINGLTPPARKRLVRDAWKKANPTWTVPSSSSTTSSSSTPTSSR